MKRLHDYLQRYQEINPDWVDSLSLYKNAIASEVTGSTVLLDIGCGHSTLLEDVYAITPHTYGIDPDKNGIEKNRLISHKTVGMADDMPYDDSFFDVIVSAWVVEHLENPEQVFKEIFRVLKPGGCVVFLTPNSWNYIVWINRMIPDMFHDYLTQKLYGRQQHDTFPVQYKMNSVPSIRNQMNAIGFVEEVLLLNSDPRYIAFNDILFWISCKIEDLLSTELLQQCRVHIVGKYRKP